MWEATTAGGTGSFHRDGTPAPKRTDIWNTTTVHCIASPYQPGDNLFVSPATTCSVARPIACRTTSTPAAGNGDAHLKNFGVLYADPTDKDVRMSPAYDLVNTTAYIRNDSLALTLGSSKSLFASRKHLLEFGHRCGMGAPVFGSVSSWLPSSACWQKSGRCWTPNRLCSKRSERP